MLSKREDTYIRTWIKRLKCLHLFGNKCCICEKDIEIFDYDFHHKCGKEKEISRLFGRTFNVILKELNKCILVCSQCHRHIHYNNEQSTCERMEKSRNILFDYKGTKTCYDCKKDFKNIDLCFHHLKPKKKKFKISQEINYHRWKSLENVQEEILEEIDNCIVLCHRCHRKRHFDFEKFEKYKDEINKRVYNPQKPSLDANKIYKEYKEGKRIIDLSREYDRNKSTISTIIKRKEQKN